MAHNFYKIESWKRAGLDDAALRALETAIEQHLEAHVVTAFGKDVWLNLRFSSFLSKGQKHLLVFTYDITECRRAEVELKASEDKPREQKDALEQKNIALREVLEKLEIEKNSLREIY